MTGVDLDYCDMLQFLRALCSVCVIHDRVLSMVTELMQVRNIDALCIGPLQYHALLVGMQRLYSVCH